MSEIIRPLLAELEAGEPRGWLSVPYLMSVLEALTDAMSEMDGDGDGVRVQKRPTVGYEADEHYLYGDETFLKSAFLKHTGRGNVQEPEGEIEG